MSKERPRQTEEQITRRKFFRDYLIGNAVQAIAGIDAYRNITTENKKPNGDVSLALRILGDTCLLVGGFGLDREGAQGMDMIDMGIPIPRRNRRPKDKKDGVQNGNEKTPDQKEK